MRSLLPALPLRLRLAPLFLAATLWTPAQATTPADLQRGYEARADAPGQAERGQAFFTRSHGGEWSCASCHGERPTGAGRHAVTGKALDPLAPAFNPRAFTDERRVEKWLRRNCQDVARRECTPAEKADVLAWLQTLR
ncbi:DUF1924 domain-containing protein [Pelomonas sp. APW6]|uniref:DUF1924 domain-containing protein n=1 Tax=Roseateles subflavus TaxID=3053353 RepID=A0ABT7LQG9_9BURK|nr:DUF1924 domain-containing protein [Pelomonas sp. APW6]MDL5034689.1 DUF1924 domain-containing protein [Pelomonas sp. APW6]